MVHFCAGVDGQNMSLVTVNIPLQEEDNQKIYSPDREIFMAIISEIEEHDDDPMGRVDLIDYNSSNYDEYLFDVEAHDSEPVNYEIPPPSPGITVIVHLEDDQSELKKIRNQKRNMRRYLTKGRRLQVGDSFDYSNSDLPNVINIGRDAHTVIINRRKECEKQKHTAQPPTIDNPTTASATRASVAISVLHLHRRQSSQRTMLH
jgi:hypothetical protein